MHKNNNNKSASLRANYTRKEASDALTTAISCYNFAALAQILKTPNLLDNIFIKDFEAMIVNMHDQALRDFAQASHSYEQAFHAFNKQYTTEQKNRLNLAAEHKHNAQENKLAAINCKKIAFDALYLNGNITQTKYIQTSVDLIMADLDNPLDNPDLPALYQRLAEIAKFTATKHGKSVLVADILCDYLSAENNNNTQRLIRTGILEQTFSYPETEYPLSEIMDKRTGDIKSQRRPLLSTFFKNTGSQQPSPPASLAKLVQQIDTMIAPVKNADGCCFAMHCLMLAISHLYQLFYPDEFFILSNIYDYLHPPTDNSESLRAYINEVIKPRQTSEFLSHTEKRPDSLRTAFRNLLENTYHELADTTPVQQPVYQGASTPVTARIA